MLPGYLLSAVSLCSAALLTTATDAGVAHLEARDNTMHDVVHAGLVERDLAERAPDPCPAGNCPCTSGQCPRPRPHGKSKNPDKIYRGIDFSRQNSQTFVRFILASSMRVGSVPLVIDTKECLDNITAGYPLNDPEAVDAVYNRKPLQTRYLVEDPIGARNCMAYRMINLGGGNGGVFNLKKWSGYPVGVRIANDSESTIGWDYTAEANGTSKISWVKQSKTKAVSGRVVMDCTYWWSQEPNDGPRWHGKRCLMRLQSPGQGNDPAQNKPNMCIAADKTNGGDAKPLLFAPCNRDDESQVWHLEATAQEYPTFRCDDINNQSCWGNYINKNPREILQRSGSCKQANGTVTGTFDASITGSFTASGGNVIPTPSGGTPSPTPSGR